MESIKKGSKKSCCCVGCQTACIHKPGWFLPGEIEKVAVYLGISIEELFNTKLAIDWWEMSEPIFLLSPMITIGSPGVEFPADPNGKCIFFEDTLCTIHPVKPFECQEYIHDDKRSIIDARHENIAMSWKPHQDQIRKLLGRDPQANEFNPTWNL